MPRMKSYVPSQAQLDFHDALQKCVPALINWMRPLLSKYDRSTKTGMSNWISAVVEFSQMRYGKFPTSRWAFVADALVMRSASIEGLITGKSMAATYEYLAEMLGDYYVDVPSSRHQKRFVYQRNAKDGGSRVPLSPEAQQNKCLSEIEEVVAHFRAHPELVPLAPNSVRLDWTPPKWSPPDGRDNKSQSGSGGSGGGRGFYEDESPSPGSQFVPNPNIHPAPDAKTPDIPVPDDEEYESQDESPVPNHIPDREPYFFCDDDVDTFLSWLSEVREEETRRSEVAGKPTEILESITGMRAALNAKALFGEGISVTAAIHALTLDWPQESRNRYNVIFYDVSTFRQDERKEGEHNNAPYAHAVLRAGIPMALIGGAGVGKSTLMRNLCERWPVDTYGFVPMTAGATPGWIVGAYTMDGYKSRPAMEILRHGGLFVFEEFDASDPNMLLVANDLIECKPGQDFFNPVTGDPITKHEHCRFIANMNTLGLGRTSSFSGRTKLDMATRNRFALGRLTVERDDDLERFLFTR